MRPITRLMPRSLYRFILCIAIASSVTTLPAVAHAQEGRQLAPLPQGELDVVKVLLAQERAWNDGDIEAFASSYKNSPDTVFMGAEEARGFDAMVARYKKAYLDKATMGTLTYSGLEPRLLDDHYAVLTGHFALERDKKHGGAASGIFSLVLEKTPQGWKIILDHTT